MDGLSEEESLERRTHDGIEEEKFEEDGEERHHVEELMQKTIKKAFVVGILKAHKIQGKSSERL